MSMIETIAFDFGQVIGFFDHGCTLGKLAQFTDMPAAEMFAAIYDSELEDEFEAGRIAPEEFLGRFRTLCRLRDDCEDAFLRTAFGDIFWPNDEVCALVPRLRPRYRLVLGSNTNPLHARQFVPQFRDVLRHFDGLVLSHEIGARKPQPAFFDHCRRLTGSRPERCVFIDDLPANVAGARACGWKGIVYTGGDALLDALAKLGVVLDAPPSPQVTHDQRRQASR
jgi:putative hydrolase of the HAD superfamily